MRVISIIIIKPVPKTLNECSWGRKISKPYKILFDSSYNLFGISIALWGIITGKDLHNP